MRSTSISTSCVYLCVCVCVRVWVSVLLLLFFSDYRIYLFSSLAAGVFDKLTRSLLITLFRTSQLGDERLRLGIFQLVDGKDDAA